MVLSSYGFKDTSHNMWRFCLRYTAVKGELLLNDRPGLLPATLDVDRYHFYSYLTYSAPFNELGASERAAVLASLPITRVSAEEPGTGVGTTQSGRGYARSGVGVVRDTFTAA
jgi:hypothetical protein